MSTIVEKKQQLEDLRKELRAANEHAVAIANVKTTQLQDMLDAKAQVENLQIREQILMQDLEIAENEGKVKDKKPAAAPKSGFANYGEFANAVRNACIGNGRDERLIRDSATGMNETTAAEGGYLVPPEYANEVMDFVETKSILYPQARKVTIKGNRLVDNYINEATRTDPSSGSRHGGIMAYWKAEAAQLAAVKAAIAQRETDAEKLTAYSPVTDELLADAPALEATLDNLVSKEFAFQLDDSILNGAGHNTYFEPLGILNASNNALVTIAKESGQAAGTVVFENILKMFTAMIAQCRSNAKWYVNQDIEMQLMKMVMTTGELKSNGASKVEDITGTFGMPIYMFPGAYGNENGKLLGKDVVYLEQCSAPGTAGDIIFADMSQYLIVNRADITKQVSMHVRFDYDESVFKYTMRVGGRPEWMNKITPYKGSTQRSPYVTLAARA